VPERLFADVGEAQNPVDAAAGPDHGGLSAPSATTAATASSADAGARIRLLLAWTAAGLPLAWGVWTTVTKASALFR
jgi:hypothetical protein